MLSQLTLPCCIFCVLHPFFCHSVIQTIIIVFHTAQLVALLYYSFLPQEGRKSTHRHSAKVYILKPTYVLTSHTRMHTTFSLLTTVHLLFHAGVGRFTIHRLQQSIGIDSLHVRHEQQQLQGGCTGQTC